MPTLSMHMHFGKIILENITQNINKINFVFGLLSPITIYDKLSNYHSHDEDGNIDIREFYEKFDLNNLTLNAKSYVLGYYSGLWLEEYNKFNTNKLTVHNRQNLSDENLSYELDNLVKYYDIKAIGDYYNDIKNSINNYTQDYSLSEIKYIDINAVKQLILSFFDEKIAEKMHYELIDESEYNAFLEKSCNKILNSL